MTALRRGRDGEPLPEERSQQEVNALGLALCRARLAQARAERLARTIGHTRRQRAAAR